MSAIDYILSKYQKLNIELKEQFGDINNYLLDVCTFGVVILENNTNSTNMYLYNENECIMECRIEKLDNELCSLMEKSKQIYPDILRDGLPVIFKERYTKVKNSIKKKIERKLQVWSYVSDLQICEDKIFYFCANFKKNFYKKYKYLFNNYNWNLESNSYASYLIQILDITFDKYRELMHFGLESSTVLDAMTSKTIRMLAAEDMTVGRGIVSYSIILAISALTYEGEYCFGKIAISQDAGRGNYSHIVEFERTIPLNKDNQREIRKLLEMAVDDYCLLAICNAKINCIWGMGKIIKKSKLHFVEFSGYMKWKILYQNNELFAYEKERFYLSIGDEIEKKLELIKPYFPTYDFAVLQKIIRELKKQEHGGMIIVSTNAKNETERLCGLNRGRQIVPIKLVNEKEYILKMSSVDGAIVIDGKGTCYGFGVILDGKAEISGETSRGARYNSANNYVALCNKRKKRKKRKKRVFACVVSEDKTVDILY